MNGSVTRRSLFSTRWKAGEAMAGVIVKMPAPALVEVCGHAGFDLVVIDTEHGLHDGAALEHHLRAAAAADIPALVRVGSAHEAEILRALDAGADGVVVPHVVDLAAAQCAVAAAHYPPRGRRSVAVTTRAGAQGLMPLPEHLQLAEERTMVFVQVEDAEAAANAFEIASCPGVDAVFIGPSDLSLSIGLPGQHDHPQVRGLIDQISHAVYTSDNTGLCVLADSAGHALELHADGVRLALFNASMLIARHLAGVVAAIGSGGAAGSAVARGAAFGAD